MKRQATQKGKEPSYPLLYVHDRTQAGRLLGSWTLKTGRVIEAYAWLAAPGEIKGKIEFRSYPRGALDAEELRCVYEEIEPEIAQRLRRLLELTVHDSLYIGHTE